MKKIALILSFLCLGHISFSQDTIRVKAFNYNSQTRDTVITFPDGTESFRQIVMRYNMRCKNALVSDGTNRNRGCGEWDYSCNTYIEDNSRTDSLPAVTSDYSISNFTGSTFNYSNSATNTHYRNKQRKVTLNSVTDSTSRSIGVGSHQPTYIVPVSTNAESGYAGKSQYMYTAAELTAAGIAPGEIDAIALNSLSTSLVSNLQINILATTADSLRISNLETDGFANVFSDDVPFSIEKKLLTFHTPFVWDGISNLIFEFTSNTKATTTLKIESHDIDSSVGITAFSGHTLYFDGTSNYVESDAYKGILGTSDRTIDAWIKTTKVNGEICSWGTDRGGEKWVFRVNGDGTLRTEVNGGGVNGTTVIADGEWHHVACVFSGTDVTGIKHYVDGVLETNGTVTNRTINTTSGLNVRISRGVNNRYFKGNIDGVRIWNTALSATEIAQYKNKLISPQDSRIVLNYKFDVVDNNVVLCSANTPQAGKIIGYPSYSSIRAQAIFKDYYNTPYRPNMNFYQGTFDVSINDVTTFDLVPNNPNQVIRYEMKNNAGTNLDDEKIAVETSEKWNADTKEYFYDENLVLYDSADIASDGSITIGQLNYMRRWPSRLEIMSFVTPYGIGLDLGPEGKTWTFDMTDFTPILKGDKRIFLSRGGQNQEEMDIEFLFIKGTPPRDVLDIREIWPSQQITANYTQILNDTYYPATDFTYDANAKGLKLRSAITGHGQAGEFIPRDHTYTVNGTNQYERTVWKECADNPVYPQGGTWIYDRAGWCPGMATDVAEYDISSFMNESNTVNLDYTIDAGEGDSRYIISSQVVTYGDYNHKIDASITDILSPSSKVEYARDNPMCSTPTIEITNYGSEILKDAVIEYWINDRSNVKETTWYGDIDPGESAIFYLSIERDIWASAKSTNNTFHARIKLVNSQVDEDATNNEYISTFDLPKVFPKSFYLFTRSNNFGNETKISIKDEWGNIVFSRDDFGANQIVRDTITLGLGCYNLTIDDSDDDGLSFFANADGSGFFRVMQLGGGIIHNFNNDFGKRSTIKFTVEHPLTVEENELDLGLKCYPNPTYGKLTLEGYDMSDVSCRVLNSVGQIVLEQKMDIVGKQYLNIGGNPAGLYFVQVERDGVFWTQKVVLSK